MVAINRLIEVEQSPDVDLDVLGHLSDLLDLVKETKGDSMLARDMQAAIDADDPAKIRAAIAAFYALPEAEQRAILRGWSADPDRATREDMALLDAGLGIQRVLVLHPDAKPGMRADHEYVHSSTAAPCRILIREGARHEEVLADLRQAIRLVKQHWPRLIDAHLVQEV